MAEMTDRFNSLYMEAMNSDIGDSLRVHRLEQQKGVAFAIDWLENTKEFVKFRIEEEK